MSGTPSRIGGYPIERELGRGGMGVVYLGRDPRLGRPVAIKVLPDAVAGDPERLARFEREARVLASLRHPNVAGIYGVEDDGPRRLLVLEYVEGDTLAERLARGPLSVAESLDVARQIAAALEFAHESGVIHRDLKPGNVKLTPSGEVKVLDFGLAKGVAEVSPGSSPNMTQSPTMTHAATSAGVILGTAAYMSPEQARGRGVDKRTDIWSFGCVLYECLTGRQAFAGETVSDVIARILQGEAEWNALPARTPARVRALLRRCLEKDARRRQRDLGDARLELEDVIATGTSGAHGPAEADAPAASRGRLITLAIGAGLGALLASLAWLAPRVLAPDRTPRLTRFEVGAPPGSELQTEATDVTISPDGRTLAFVALDSALVAHLWVRPIDSIPARMLPGTDGAQHPFWSPDGRNIGFFSLGRLRVSAVASGEVRSVCDVVSPRGGTWSPRGVILFAPRSEGPIMRVSADGVGDPVAVTRVDSLHGATGHRFPKFLPDGRHFYYSEVPGHQGQYTIRIGSLDGGDADSLTRAGSDPEYVAPGYLVFWDGHRLEARRFNAASRRLSGEPIPLADHPAGTRWSGASIVSAGNNGTLVMLRQLVPVRRLAWFDLKGHETGAVPLAPGPYGSVALAPDGRRAALVRGDEELHNALELVDLERGLTTRVSEERGSSESPRWSPDGRRLAYQTSLGGSPQSIVIRDADGASPPIRPFEGDPAYKQLDSWSPDGRFLVVARQDAVTKFDLWIVPTDGDSGPKPWLLGPANEAGGSISPDGHWMAYLSDETGRTEAYVQSFPTPGHRYQLSTHGAFVCRWQHDGRLAFAGGDDPTTLHLARLVSEPDVHAVPLPGIVVPKDIVDADITADDARLLALIPAGSPPHETILVVQHWSESLKRP